MSSPEAREIRQCTYTPVRNDPVDPGHDARYSRFRPDQPFLKLMGIDTAFIDADTSRRILPSLQKKYANSANEDQILKAVDELWARGSLAAAKKLAGVPAQSVFSVCREALNFREQALRAVVPTNPVKSVSLRKSKPISDASTSAVKNVMWAVRSRENSVLEAYLLSNPIRFYPLLLNLLTRDRRTMDALTELARVEPVGMLHLERIVFDPIGYRRGELVYSVPLTPGEMVRLVHKEWTRTEREFQSSTRTSIETEVEDSLSEKTELTESTQVQQQHNEAFNTAVSASGSYGPVSISASVGYNADSSESSSREQSASRTKEITRKAASRSKKESKISFRLTEESRTEKENYRELKNESAEPVRWDFYRVMKLWQVSLYRYGIRLTYDLVLPEPSSYMLRRYIRLRQIEEALKTPIPLSVRIGDIQPETWQRIAEEQDVALMPPPVSEIQMSFGREITLSQNLFAYGHIEIKVPDGYSIDPERIVAIGAGVVREGDGRDIAFVDPMDPENRNRLRAGGKNDPAFLWNYLVDADNEVAARNGQVITLTLDVTMRPKESAYQEWRAKNYEKLLMAHEARQETRRLQLEDERDAFRASLSGIDPLILRKKEKEEIMKGVLRFLLGPDFRFYPPHLSMLEGLPDNELGLYDAQSGGLRPGVSADWLRRGQIIRFLHHAIEWENVNYVMYPYFWSDPDRWDLKQNLLHEDFVHQAFLQAGAARVVLTIRPGFEESFLAFMETADSEGTLPAEHPYMTIAQEIKALAQTRYPYTPGANDESPDNLVDQWREFTPTVALDVMQGTTLDTSGS